jgi:hypothetical protein
MKQSPHFPVVLILFFYTTLLMQDTLYTALGDISFYDAHFVKVSQINKFCSTEQISQAWLETI